MRRLLSFLVLLITLLSAPSFSADGPEAFLSALLTSDFAGEFTPRIGFWAVRNAVAHVIGELKKSSALNTGPEQDFQRRSITLYEADLAALDALRPNRNTDETPAVRRCRYPG